jgi:L-rhamnose mutarotase
MKNKRYCLALDLKNNKDLISEYINYHKKVWPEIIQSIKNSGINSMEIYNISDRLFMIAEVSDDFSFEAKEKSDKNNPKVQEWENLMWKYQKALPIAKKGEKWVLMNSIFKI